MPSERVNEAIRTSCQCGADLTVVLRELTHDELVEFMARKVWVSLLPRGGGLSLWVSL